MLIKKNRKVKWLIAGIVLLLIIFIWNMSGFYFKVNDDRLFYAYSYPITLPDLDNASHPMEIAIKSTQDSEAAFTIYASRRRGFWGMYWEKDSNNLWVDYEYGISCFRYEGDNHWQEWYLVEELEQGFRLRKSTGVGSIYVDRSDIPINILDHLDNRASE